MANPPFKVKAIYEYSSPHEDDLNFPSGQIVTVIAEEDDDWYVGEYDDASGDKKQGLFPKNFVEKYEPPVPTRPSRPTRPKVEQPPAPVAPIEEPSEEASAPIEEPELRKPQAAPAPELSPRSPPTATAKPQAEAPNELPAAPKPVPSAPAAKAPPPAISEKPSSFKDRIAAFNKGSAPPIAPKPQGAPGTSSFIKKPYVAPPPSKNAYIPPARESAPQKVYRREEDPEVAERQAQDNEAAEAAGLAGSGAAAESPGEDAPKPQSLKDRIALLQKQQAEQAMRRAEASQKEKPKKPHKKPSEPRESQESNTIQQEDVPAPEQLPRASTDLARETGRKSTDTRTSRGPRSPDSTNQPRELFSDGNDADQSAAGETTEDAEGTSGLEDIDERIQPSIPTAEARAPAAPKEEPNVGDEEDTTEEEEDEESEEDAETKRKLELRERMAKMSGGMGMAGMFGPPMPVPGAASKKKKSTTSNKDQGEAENASPTAYQSHTTPMVPVPGMQRTLSPKQELEVAPLNVSKDEELSHPITSQHAAEEVPDVEDIKPEPPARRSTDRRSIDRAAPPPVPQERPIPPLPSERAAPPPPAAESRPIPPPPAEIQSETPGSESDDELSTSRSKVPARSGTTESIALHQRGAPPPVPGRDIASAVPPAPPQTHPSTRSSTLSSDIDPYPTSRTIPVQEKRTSRAAPTAGASPTHISRAPPPPPPTGPPLSRPEDDNEDEVEEETEYEGDYDTDIAPGAKHKDALKSHLRDSSLDESTLADEKSLRSPSLPAAAAPPPIPNATRAAPPPPPQQPPKSRPSMDAPRVAPPPVPTREPSMGATVTGPPGPDYDPYRYDSPPPAPSRRSTAPGAPAPAPPRGPPQIPPLDPLHREDDELYSSSPPRVPSERPPPLPPQPPPQDRAPPPRPSHNIPAIGSSSDSPVRAPPRQSLDVNRTMSTARRSMDQPRPSGDGFMATDVNLGESTQWWTRPNTPPPVFHNRKDIRYEIEESSSADHGGKTTISKDVYILFLDYSQTIITARFDTHNPADVNLEQRHEPPPPRLRQDQLEDAHSRFGAKIAEAVNSKQNTVVGDGTPHSLILELFRPLQSVLAPVGTRAYGALVYANMANATIQQYDEIRPGDIITLRNAKLQGKHGPMHQKYSMEVGTPEHVAVVAEWDGTKKKVRAFEQGREGKKVKMESFKVGDLRSGEVKVWRVMGRDWVGWEG
ncbi:hypothetical protein EV356DRAFT_462735 [Viridothelium virens]|uniref:SH3 domain-containing protein n=1 Tax=Viridothelium virens TaxID=1048519 RepID=A0A6A6HFX4_VIRVR|nr:hypothetical protein EV356DRAFT_462735 [Viridothelium virens]